MNREPSASSTVRAPEFPVYYPLFLKLSGKKAVVIGGGRVAERKIVPLVKAGARVTVVSPKITRKIEQLKRQKRVDHTSRPYRKGDLRDAWFVIAATDSPAVNERVSRDATCLVNVVDTPRLCNCIVPSTIARGPLNIAISTSGISPALSRSIRKELEKAYGSEFRAYLRFLKRIRMDAMALIHDKKTRTGLLKSIASEAVLEKVRGKGLQEMKKRAADMLKTSHIFITAHGGRRP